MVIIKIEKNMRYYIIDNINVKYIINEMDK